MFAKFYINNTTDKPSKIIDQQIVEAENDKEEDSISVSKIPTIMEELQYSNLALGYPQWVESKNNSVNRNFTGYCTENDMSSMKFWKHENTLACNSDSLVLFNVSTPTSSTSSPSYYTTINAKTLVNDSSNSFNNFEFPQATTTTTTTTTMVRTDGDSLGISNTEASIASLPLTSAPLCSSTMSYYKDDDAMYSYQFPQLADSTAKPASPCNIHSSDVNSDIALTAYPKDFHTKRYNYSRIRNSRRKSSISSDGSSIDDHVQSIIPPVSSASSSSSTNSGFSSSSGKKVSDSRLSAHGLAEVLKLDSPEEALKIEKYILDIFEKELHYPLGYKTWVRDTSKDYRLKLIAQLHARVKMKYPQYTPAVLETIVRRGTYYMMQSRLRRERRAKAKQIMLQRGKNST